MHEPVLINEVVDLLAVKPGGCYIDGTLGNGGHARGVLEKAGSSGTLVGIDRDEQALGRARSALAGYGKNVCLVHGNYADMADIAGRNGIKAVDGILIDLGVSSEQLEEGMRGFSFAKDGPLDMRMDVSGGGETAADLVNRLSEDELRGIILEFGEERMARRIAGFIVRERAKGAIVSTGNLAGIVERAVGGRRGRIHPATRTFQALRIRVNDELGSLERGLSAGVKLLAPKGRMAVISFHSLEDRIVKRFFVSHAGRWESLQAGGRRWIGERPQVRIITRKPVVPSESEMNNNPRSRSAKLRVAERLERE